MSKFALTVSFRKSYSSSIGYSNSLHRFLTSYTEARTQYSPVRTQTPTNPTTHIDLCIVNFERVNIIIVFVDLVFDIG